MISKTLGHYQITNQLGKGGMGEVYQAKDQKLGRSVAIKVLPEEFARDADRVARFQREAKVLASLNHPNIAAIHGLEESSGTNFLVLELVEGETLADQLKRGPLPIEDSLKLGVQIAEALEAAHAKGIIHRDLKPANIKVTPEGKVKVLDFGLAKAFAGEQAEMNLSNSPTLSNAATQQGIILGTAAYMSPEQARGKAVDKRADIWSFGCVFYEMLTGRQAFQGEDVAEILASVIKGESNLNLLPAKIHPRVREVLSRCLQKDLNKRYRDIGDAQIELEQVLADPSGVLQQPALTLEPRKRLRTMLPWLAATLVLAAIVGVVIWNFRPSPPPEPRRVIRFSYELPKDTSGLAVSPDGKQFVYSTPGGLYLRAMDELESRLIPGTEGKPDQPFFSPDGKWVGFWSQSDYKLKKIAVTGGAPVDLCNVPILAGANWNSDNTIIYSDPAGKGIMRISADGGTPEVLVQQKGFYNWPQLLPDGKSVLFTDFSAQPQKIRVHSPKSGNQKELVTGRWGWYLPTGHLVYAVGDGPVTLFAVPFNLEKLEVAGTPVTITKNIRGVTVSDSGTLIYLPAGTTEATPASQRIPVWVDQKGKEEPIAGAPDNLNGFFKISPDGKRVALSSVSGLNDDVWIWDLAGGNMTRLTFEEGNDTWPLWTPDGQRIVYVSARDRQKFNISMKAADGTGGIEKLGSFPAIPAPLGWSKDGDTLVVAVVSFSPMQSDIVTISLKGDHSPNPLLHESYIETQPSISPDGRWIAYVVVDESHKMPEIYVNPFPDVNRGKWQVSTTGGIGPLWSPDGRKLFYRNGDAVMAVEVETNPTFKPDKPKELFRKPYYYWVVGGAALPVWDIHPDGKRFLMLKEEQPTGKATASEAPLRFNIVLNWFEELKQRVPTK
jgi:serine/threonine-protein kinase